MSILSSSHTSPNFVSLDVMPVGTLLLLITGNFAEREKGQRWVYARFTGPVVEAWEWLERGRVNFEENTSGAKHFVHFTLPGQILNFLTSEIEKQQWKMVPQ